MKLPKRFSSLTLVTIASAWAVLGFFATHLLAQTGNGGGRDDISFSKDVLPILQARCVRCHDADRAEADLRFDSDRAAVQNGGHTGRPILGSSADDSELIRRVNSTKRGYRMPKDGPPLSDSEIATLTQWVESGAQWDVPGQAVTDPLTNDPSLTIADRVVWFESQMKDPGFSGLMYLSVVFCVVMVVMFLHLRRTQSDNAWLSRLKTIGIFLLLFLCLATYIHYDAKHKEALLKVASVKAELLSYTGPPETLHSLNAPHPMHPPRLGGVYYRGNDERDGQLFNGGFYRTAQLEVWLTDGEGQRLKWGDKPDGELFVDFEIIRAANTTGELFNDQIMSVVGLTDDVRISNDADHRTEIGTVMPMETIEPGQRWRSRYLIGVLEDSNQISGKLYLVQNTSKPKAHYAIEFEVVLDTQSLITEDSQMWMGSLYNLNGRVFVPYDNQKILLDRWFDFRPIPEITGPQTDDPHLLGIPEHQ